MNISTSSYDRLKIVHKLLKYTYGVVLIIIGSDKFLDMIVLWQKYISPLVSQNLPIDNKTFLILFGAAEILTGLLILSKYTRIGAYISVAVLVAVILNLLSMGMYYDIAARDLVIAVGAFALAQLDEIIQDIRSTK